MLGRLNALSKSPSSSVSTQPGLEQVLVDPTLRSTSGKGSSLHEEAVATGSGLTMDEFSRRVSISDINYKVSKLPKLRTQHCVAKDCDHQAKT